MADIGESAKILVVTDGRRGNENQALGLAEAIQRIWPGGECTIAVARLTLRAWARWAPPRALDMFGWIGGFSGLLWVYSAKSCADIRQNWRIVIGAGRRSAPYVAMLRDRGAMAVQLLRPQISLDRFDFVVTPRHDKLVGENVIETIGSMHRIRPDLLSSLAIDPAVRAVGRPRIAVMIGGPSKSVTFCDRDGERLRTTLADLATRGFGVMATASPRTPDKIHAALVEAVRDNGGYFWDGASQNPYLSLLAAADAVIVTADSVNMASEAVATGKPVYVAPLSRIAPKLESFHDTLQRIGATKSLEALIDADPNHWTPTPLDDVSPVARRIVAYFQDQSRYGAGTVF